MKKDIRRGHRRKFVAEVDGFSVVTLTTRGQQDITIRETIHFSDRDYHHRIYTNGSLMEKTKINIRVWRRTG